MHESRDFIVISASRHMASFADIKFVSSAVSPAGFPPEDRPEVAFVGRSNVGKSTAINALASRRRVAFASKTPGRTQTINFFELGKRARLVDLPGYGYAAVPLEIRAKWDELVGGYLSGRRSLAAVVVLMDARRPLKEHDLQLFEWMRGSPARLLVLLSKADKLTRSAGLTTLAKVNAALRAKAHNGTTLLFSAPKRQGVEEARELLENWLEEMAAGPGALPPE
jgi:GTP-binding protein